MSTRIVLDTDQHSLRCAWCEEPIFGGALIIYGVESSQYLTSYHPDCEAERLAFLATPPGEPPTLRPSFLR
jgi:hypothetical protein